MPRDNGPPGSKGLYLVLCLSVPRKQPLTQAAKTEIGRKADHADHKNAGEDSLGAKCLLRFEHHIPHTDRRADHLGGDDHDQRYAPSQSNSRENVGQAGRQDDALEYFKLRRAKRTRGADQIDIDASRSGKGIQDDWEGCRQRDDENLRPVANSEPKDRRNR